MIGIVKKIYPQTPKILIMLILILTQARTKPSLFVSVYIPYTSLYMNESVVSIALHILKFKSTEEETTVERATQSNGRRFC